MTTPGGVANLPMGALTLDTLAQNLQNMSGDAMKTRAVERFPTIMDNSTGLSPVSDLTPFGILTRIWAEVNSLVANADPNDINGPEDIPDLLLEFIEGIPVVGQFVQLFEAILGTYDGEDEVLLAIQAIFAPIRALIQLFTGVGGEPPLIDVIGAVSTSAAQAADLVKQIAAGVAQIVQSAAAPPQFDFLEDALNAFLFWTVGWFGLTQQANSPSNPAIVATQSRQEALTAALLSSGTRSGFKDHFDRPILGSDWGTHGSYPPLAIVLNQTSDGYLSSGTTIAGHYLGDHFITDNWHLQFTAQDISLGISRFAVGDSGFTNGVAVEIESFTYGVDISLHTLSSGLGSLGTQRSIVHLANGVFKAGDVLGIEYIDADNTFYLFHNGQEIQDLRWEDTGNVVTHSTSNGEVGVIVNVSNTTLFPGPGLDDMSGYDIQVA